MAADTIDLGLLRANAWCGDAPAEGDAGHNAGAWCLRSTMGHIKQPLASYTARIAPGLDRADWANERVGWGVVLPDREDRTAAQKAAAIDAPEPVRRLIAARFDAPVFYYRRDVGRYGRLQRYFADGKSSTLSASGTRGRHVPTAVPHYLLLVGTPDEIPWDFQYRLQCDAYVGRLDLAPDALARYVDALLGEWADSPRDAGTPLLWSVDHGHPDITYLMRKAIAEKLHVALLHAGYSAHLLTDCAARHADLATALATRSPAFVLTTSHGATFPLDDVAALRAQLGLLVDRDHMPLDVSALLDVWQPDGAIWYAHACCSAGANRPSGFQGLVDADSSLGRILAGIAAIGPCTAPLPTALLGAARPLGAFIGHVEPTFDWTLRQPDTGQRMTDSLILDTLFDALHAQSRPPVGLAMDRYYDAVAGLLLDHGLAVQESNDHVPGARPRAMKAKLQAMDRLAMVVLGDPTVRLPAHGLPPLFSTHRSQP